MSTRTFVIVVGLVLVAVWLATTPLGVMVGFFAGIAMAFFVGPTVFLLHVPENVLPWLGWGLLAAWLTWSLVLAVRGLRDWLDGTHGVARSSWARAIVVAAVPLVLKLSVDAMVAAWH